MRTKGFHAALGFAFVLLGCAGHDPSGDAAEHDALGVDIEAIVGGTPATSYPAAAVLNMRAASGGGYGCSGVLIAPKVVLTAGHCVDGMVAWDVYVGASSRSTSRGETFDWKENGATTVNPNHHDIGLVYLNDAITLPAYPVLATDGVPNNTAAVNVGRVLNGAVTNSLYAAPVALHDGHLAGYPFDYYATDVIEHGDSGGPVFISGTQTIVAINSGAGGTTEVLARVDLVRAWIQQRIAAQTPAPAPAPTPSSTAPAPPPAADAGAPATGACTNEIEPNDSVATSTTFQGSACGALGTKTDVDRFTMTAAAGKTTIALTAPSDASFSIGFPINDACLFALTNARQVVVSASGAVKLCLAVSSPSHATQTYRITSAH